MAALLKSLVGITDHLSQWSKNRIRDTSGQTMVEYVMLIVLVALAVFLLAPNIKDAILKVFSNTSSAMA